MFCGNGEKFQTLLNNKWVDSWIAGFLSLFKKSSVNCLACGAFERNFGPLGEAKNPPTICYVA